MEPAELVEFVELVSVVRLGFGPCLVPPDWLVACLFSGSYPEPLLVVVLIGWWVSRVGAPGSSAVRSLLNCVEADGTVELVEVVPPVVDFLDLLQ